MGAAPDLRSTRLKAAAALTLANDDLAIFFLNVGDGDAIVIRFPQENNAFTFGVVDAYNGGRRSTSSTRFPTGWRRCHGCASCAPPTRTSITSPGCGG